MVKTKDPHQQPTDTSVSTDKVTTATISTYASTALPRSSSHRSERSDEDDKSINTDDLNNPSTSYDNLPDFTPPLRIHAVRGPERLQGSAPSGKKEATLQIPPELQNRAAQGFRRRKSDPSMRSGSRSPMSHNNFDGGSSISSLEEVDPDILTDKMGILELDLREQQQSARGLNASCSSLPPVTERMSEATLEDCYAFADVRREGSVSRGNSITTGGEVSSNILEPLDECEDEDSNEGGRVILTNMEEILEVAEEDAADNADDAESLPST